MGFFNNQLTRFINMCKKALQPLEVPKIERVIEEDKVNAKVEREFARLTGRIRNKTTLRRSRLRQGKAMLDTRGQFLTPHDIRCLELAGCDLEVLASLRMGEIPDHAPNSELKHPLQIRKDIDDAIAQHLTDKESSDANKVEGEVESKAEASIQPACA